MWVKTGAQGRMNLAQARIIEPALAGGAWWIRAVFDHDTSELVPGTSYATQADCSDAIRRLVVGND